MICGSCGKECHRIHAEYNKSAGKTVEYCDQCGDTRAVTFYDVYFDKPYFDEHLADETSPHGTFIMSRGHKAMVMKRMGLVEAGHRVRGARREHEGNHYGERKKFGIK
jgi:hypothetical protein